MDVKLEFVALAVREGANRRELCRRFGIAAKAGYALLARYEREGDAAFVPRSRRPLSSPRRTPAALEHAVLALRQQHPDWGGRKLARRLSDLGHVNVPSPSTVTAILHRHGLISPEGSEAAQHWQRFEHAEPNSLWQMDFKGYFDTARGRCHPMTLLDDHSRFNLVLQACAHPDTAHVRNTLTAVFERYGLPQRINADNGSPWGSPARPELGLSELTVWLIRQGITVSHSAPYHPQTNGKLERFHRSLDVEVLKGRSFQDLDQVQCAFDRWRPIYNHQRPHDALGLDTPMQHYRPSARPYSPVLPHIEYAPDDIVLKVRDKGWICLHGIKLRLSVALYRLPVALRAVPDADGCFDVYFCHQRITRLDMNALTASN